MVDMTVRPCMARRFRNLIKLREVVESRPVVGQSRKIMEGLISSSRPIDVLFFQPPDIPRILVSPIQVSLHFYRPKFFMIEFTVFTFSYSLSSLSRRSATNLKASKGVKVGSIKSSCITQPMQLLNLPILLVSSPLILSVPLSYRFSDSCRPDMRLSIVVFPHPEGPKIAVKVLGENLPVHYFNIFFLDSTQMVFPSTDSSFFTLAMTLIFSQINSMGSTFSKMGYSSATSLVLILTSVMV